jgi:hypothetical protein
LSKPSHENKPLCGAVKKSVYSRLVKNAQTQGTRSVLNPVRTNKTVATGVATLRVRRSDKGTSITPQM